MFTGTALPPSAGRGRTHLCSVVAVVEGPVVIALVIYPAEGKSRTEARIYLWRFAALHVMKIGLSFDPCQVSAVSSRFSFHVISHKQVNYNLLPTH